MAVYRGWTLTGDRPTIYISMTYIIRLSYKKSVFWIRKTEKIRKWNKNHKLFWVRFAGISASQFVWQLNWTNELKQFLGFLISGHKLWFTTKKTGQIEQCCFSIEVLLSFHISYWTWFAFEYKLIPIKRESFVFFFVWVHLAKWLCAWSLGLFWPL